MLGLAWRVSKSPLAQEALVDDADSVASQSGKSSDYSDRRAGDPYCCNRQLRVIRLPDVAVLSKLDHLG